MMKYFRSRSSQSSDTSDGFTLIEVLVIVIIIGILSALAAPGWLAFVNNRRIGTVRSQAADAIRKAQTDAKTTQTSRAVVLDVNGHLDNPPRPPRIAIARCGTAGATSASTECALPADLTTLDWQTLGGGDVKPGAVIYTDVTKNQTGAYTIGKNANYPRLVFDGNGVVNRNLSNAPVATSVATDTPIFIIGFKLAGAVNVNAEPRCLIVQTLLGGLREGNTKKNSDGTTLCGDT